MSSADAFDNDAMLQCMLQLKTGKAVEIPIYDFKRHQRDAQTRKVGSTADLVSARRTHRRARWVVPLTWHLLEGRPDAQGG